MDFRRGPEPGYPEACGRQYWVKDDRAHYNYGIPFVYLVNGQGTCVVPYLFAERRDRRLRIVRPAPECKGGN